MKYQQSLDQRHKSYAKTMRDKWLFCVQDKETNWSCATGCTSGKALLNLKVSFSQKKNNSTV